ncbi:MAG: hypothetical protein E7620_07720 [Ruminococcaceae bacterium]|nr:hypothetical protein [Oscillospiraceae bacterium]
MRLFFYYAFCSVKNQIRKLFRTWVMVFFGVVIAMSLLIGVMGALLESSFEEPSDAPPVEETLPEEELPLTREELMDIVELIAMGVVGTVLLLNLFSADKNGVSVFLMADVNLLFQSPMRPQSVLLFRLMNQIFLSILAGLYFGFVVFSGTMREAMGVGASVAVLTAWFLTLFYGRMLNLAAYLLSTVHIRLKKWLRLAPILLVALAAGGYVLWCQLHPNDSPLTSAINLFNAPVTRWIPVIGWLKGMVMFAFEGNWWMLAVLSVLSFGGIALLYAWIQRMRVDFYEDALTAASRAAELQAAAEGSKPVKRERERSDRTLRDRLNFGGGANMFFCKTIYNRFRFAKLGIFTKTAGFYLLIGGGVALLQLYFSESPDYTVVGLILCGCAFFRAMGNPLATDVERELFITVPSSPYAKVIWSVLGGTVDCLLDLLPTVILTAGILRASPTEALAYGLLAVCVDFYCSNAMLFTQLSMPTSLALPVKQSILAMFIYFGITPIAAVVVVGVILNQLLPFLFLAAAAAVALGGVFYAVSPLFLLRGRR